MAKNIIIILIAVGWLITIFLGTESLLAKQETLITNFEELNKTQDRLNQVLKELLKTQEQLEKIQNDLKNSQDELKNNQEKLNVTMEDLLLNQNELKRTQEKLQLVQEELTITKDELQRVKEEKERIKQIRALSTSSDNSFVISSGPRNSSMVAITIDDGWDPSWILRTINILEEKDAPATFFLTGNVMRNNSSAIREPLLRAKEQGLIESGNHTQTHRRLTSLSNEEIAWELREWEEAYEYLVGTPYQLSPRWFRPPKMAGFTSPSQRNRYGSLITSLGYISVLWDVETFYGIYRERGTGVSPTEVANYVLSRARSGSIILLHFISPDIRALPLIIDELRARGLEPVTLSRLLGFSPAEK